MSPSSLIFVAVVVIWATYLVVHVARRREHLATARTVDRFSDQMRVLQRRAVRLDPPTPSAVRVSSAGMARTRPLVAQAGPDRVFSQSQTSETSATSEAAGQRVRASVLADAGDPGREPDLFTEPLSRRRGLRLPARRPGSAPARALRATALLVCLTLLAGVGVATALSALPGWALIVPALAVIGVFAWLRAAARALAAQRRREAALARRRREREHREEHEAAQAARPSAPRLPVAQEFIAQEFIAQEFIAQEFIERPVEQGQSAPVLEPVAQAEAVLVDAAFEDLTRRELVRDEPARAESARAQSAIAESAIAESARAESALAESARAESARAESARAESARAESARAESAREQAPVAARRLDPLEVAAMAHTSMDADHAHRADRHVVQDGVDPLFAEHGWEPTPVPPPTYTLKAKASRPMPEPLQVPVPIEVDEDDVAWDEERHQPRIVSA